MASLTIRDLPDDVMNRLRRAAATNRRSINAQAIHWIEEASLRDPGALGWEGLLDGARLLRAELPGGGGDSAEIIRETRDTR